MYYLYLIALLATTSPILCADQAITDKKYRETKESRLFDRAHIKFIAKRTENDLHHLAKMNEARIEIVASPHYAQILEYADISNKVSAILIDECVIKAAYNQPIDSKIINNIYSTLIARDAVLADNFLAITNCYLQENCVKNRTPKLYRPSIRHMARQQCAAELEILQYAGHFPPDQHTQHATDSYKNLLALPKEETYWSRNNNC